jgi:hypothetical protein
MAGMSRARSMRRNPFLVLGLDPGADLTDAEVLAAWRRTAAATHPDRADGGDPQRFAVAAAAYTELRTRSGRGEARADLGGPVPGRPDRLGSRLAPGGIARLALHAVLAIAAAVAGLLAAGAGPAGPALATGAATWLALAVRRNVGHDLRRVDKASL